MKQTFTIKAMALSDPAFKSLPVKRELVFPLGTPPGNDDRAWHFTAEDLAGVVAAFERRNDEYLVVDYAHGEDKNKGELAAGWIDHLELRPDGLYADIRYTDLTREEIAAGGWGYRSPTFDAEQDEVGAWHPRKLSALALTNKPAIGGMPPIKASIDSTQEPAASDGDTEKEESQMADSKTVTAAKKQSAAFDKPGLMALLRKEYGMPEAVSDDMLTKMLMEALAGAPEPEMDMEKEAEKPADLPNPLEEAVPAAASVKPRIELVETVADVKAEAEKNERVIAAVRKAASLGTITPATLDAAGKLAVADLESFETLFCSPPAPAAGQLITASAKDRSGKAASYADQIRAQRNAAIGVARQ